MYNVAMKLKTFTVLFAFLIILIVILADRDQLGFARALNEIPLGDKAGHFILYGILSFLLHLTCLRSLPTRDPRRVALSLSLLLALAIGLEEWSQNFYPARTADWVDLLFSYLGVAAGAWSALKTKSP
jgi:VanZ family protein